MSEKKPPDGFDPSAPPQDDEQDPHLQHTSPYDVETLVKALGSVDGETGEGARKFADFGPTERSAPYSPPAESGAAPAADPRLFLDDTEVLPPGTLPAGLVASARRPQPAASPRDEAALPAPPVKTPMSGERARPSLPSVPPPAAPEERPASTALQEPRSDVVAPEPVTSSVERPIVSGLAPPAKAAPPAAPGETLVPATRGYELETAIPAEVSFSMSGQRLRPKTLELPVPGAVSSAPPQVDDHTAAATTTVRAAESMVVTVDEGPSGMTDLPTLERPMTQTSAPAPVEEALPFLEPVSAPAPLLVDEPTREITIDASLIGDDPAFAEPPPTVASRTSSRPSVSQMAGLFFVALVLATTASFALFGDPERAAAPPAEEPRGRDARSAATPDPDARAAPDAAKQKRGVPGAPGGDGDDDRDPPRAEDHRDLPAAAVEPDLAVPSDEGASDNDTGVAGGETGEPKANETRGAKRRKRARKAGRAAPRTLFVVGIRDGTGKRVKGAHMALRSGFVSEVRKDRRLRVGRGAPGEEDSAVRLRLDRLDNKRAGGTWRVVANCTASLYAPGGEERRRVRAVGGAHGEKVTKGLTLAAVTACGEQVGDELRTSLRRRRR